jgi:hypothetical protein
MQQPYSPDTVREDAFFRLLQDAAPATLKRQSQPYFEAWPTDMRAVARENGL